MSKSTSATWRFDEKEAQGVVSIVEGAYGPRIQIDSKDLLYIDLFEQSPSSSMLEKHPAVVISNSQGAQSICAVHFFRDRVEFRFTEKNVEVKHNEIGYATVTVREKKEGIPDDGGPDDR